jgi:hypothetical protein
MNLNTRPKRIDTFEAQGVRYSIWVMANRKIMYQTVKMVDNSILDQKFFEIGEENTAMTFFEMKRKALTKETKAIYLPENEYTQLSMFTA